SLRRSVRGLARPALASPGRASQSFRSKGVPTPGGGEHTEVRHSRRDGRVRRDSPACGWLRSFQASAFSWGWKSGLACVKLFSARVACVRISLGWSSIGFFWLKAADVPYWALPLSGQVTSRPGIAAETNFGTARILFWNRTEQIWILSGCKCLKRW